MNIIHKDLNVHIPKKVGISKFEGEFRGVLTDLNGKVVQDSGWVKNGFTDYGIDNRHQTLNYIAIGSGSTPTTLATSRMENFLHSESSTFVDFYPADALDNYKFGSMVKATFDPGEGTGNVNEIGMHSGFSVPAPPVPYLHCREVFPSTIVKGVDNTLQVFYRVYCTPDISDTTGQVVIGGVTYDYIVRLIDIFDFKNAHNGIAVFSSNSFNHGFETPLVNFDEPRPSTLNVSRMSAINISNPKPGGRGLQWTTIAYLNECNYATGIRSATSVLNFRQNIADSPCVGMQLTAVDGPNIGAGLIKTELQYASIDWELNWGNI